MIWGIALAYIVFGLLTARDCRIRLVRQAREVQEEREKHIRREGTYTLDRCKKWSSEWDDCAICDTHLVECYNSLAFFTFLFWPVAAAVLIGIGFGKLIELLVRGTIRVVQLLGHTLSPVLKVVGALNHWFWQDPQERKKDRARSA